MRSQTFRPTAPVSGPMLLSWGHCHVGMRPIVGAQDSARSVCNAFPASERLRLVKTTTRKSFWTSTASNNGPVVRGFAVRRPRITGKVACVLHRCLEVVEGHSGLLRLEASQGRQARLMRPAGFGPE